MENENIQEIMSGSIFGKVLEMVQENSMLNVPVDPRVDISTITADDDDPKFVNLEVIRAGTSKTNRRRYGNNVVREINSMVPGLHGYFGHPDPSKFGFEFREPQCIYVGSMVEQMSDGVERSVAKAYLFKTSPLREWVPKSIAAGNPMTVSINGTGDIIRNGDVVDVVHMSEVQSIDWANPGTEGMGTSKAMSVVREQQQQLNGGNDEMEAKDIIKGITVTELKAFNPEAYNGIIASINVTELQAGNPTLYNQIKDSGATVSVSLKVGGEQKEVKIAEFQGLVTKFEADIIEEKNRVETARVTEYKNRKIEEQIPEKFRASVLKRVTGNTEKEIDDSISTEIAYIREMGGAVNTPAAPNNSDNKPEDMVSAIKAMFGVKETK